MMLCRASAIFALACWGLSSAIAGDYTDKLVGFSFTTPPNWTLNPRAPVLGGPGTCVDMQDPQATVQQAVTICGKPDILRTGTVDEALRSGLDNYILATSARWKTQLTIRPGTVEAGTIGGNASLSVIVDYNPGGKAGASYIVWVQSGKTRLSLVGETAASNLSSLIDRLKDIRDSIRIP